MPLKPQFARQLKNKERSIINLQKTLSFFNVKSEYNVWEMRLPAILLATNCQNIV